MAAPISAYQAVSQVRPQIDSTNPDDSWAQFYNAVLNNDLNTLKQQQFPPVFLQLEFLDGSHKNIWHVLAQHANTAMLEYLLAIYKRNNLDMSLLNKSDAQGYTPLHIMIEFGKVKMAELLLQAFDAELSQKAMANRTKDYQWTLAHSAALLPKDDAIKLVQEKAPDILSLPAVDDFLPLHFAAAAGTEEPLQHIVFNMKKEELAKCTVGSDQVKYSAVAHAAAGNHAGTVAILLNAQPDLIHAGDIVGMDMLRLAFAAEQKAEQPESVVVSEEEVGEQVLTASEIIAWHISPHDTEHHLTYVRHAPV